MTVEFRPGLNVLIGENNAGKTAVLSALGLLFNRNNRKRPQLHDFYQGIGVFDTAPAIRVSGTIASSATDSVEDMAVVATWLTQLEPNWEATLTYECFLPDKDAEEFKADLGDDPTKAHFFDTLERFLPRYVGRTYGGNPADKNVAEPDMLAKFDYQLLNALRDVEAEMFAGSNPILKSMLQGILDSNVGDKAELASRRGDFSRIAAELRDHVIGRLDLDSLFRLVAETGAGDGGTLNLAGRLDVDGIISALKLFIEWLGHDLPVICNGLGYNNLVYISLMLANLDFRSDQAREGQNAAIFPMLLVEEPEAHLHPALQYRLLKYLKMRTEETTKSRQLFITTHSTHITSACRLDDLICLNASEPGRPTRAAYPGRVFPDTGEGKASKKYVERFLDVTKSNILFAKAVLFVEGLAEQLVVPGLSERAGLPLPMESCHVAITAVDGSTFKHFLPLFGACESAEQKQYALSRRVACLVDSDPARKPKQPGGRLKRAWPYQMGIDNTLYDYRPVSGVIANLQAQVEGVENVLISYGKKTFEYDLAEANHAHAGLLTGSCAELATMRAYCQDQAANQADLDAILNNADPGVLADLAAMVDPDVRKRAAFATCYLISVEEAKGGHAFDLSIQMHDDALMAGLVVPDHIIEALRWVTRAEEAGA